MRIPNVISVDALDVSDTDIRMKVSIAMHWKSLVAANPKESFMFEKLANHQDFAHAIHQLSIDLPTVSVSRIIHVYEM